MMDFCSLRHRGCRRCYPCYLSRYDMTLQFLRTLFLRTRNVHYCTLRAELLMALHDLEIQVRLRPRPFRWNRNLLYFWLPVDLNQLQFVAVAARLSAALLDLLSISFTFYFLINFGFECQYCSEANVCLEFQPLSPMGHDAAGVRIGSKFLRYQACLIGIWEVFNFSVEFFYLLLLSTRFPEAGLSTSHVCADWLHDWSSAAKWAQLLITYLVAALSNTQKI